MSDDAPAPGPRARDALNDRSLLVDTALSPIVFLAVNALAVALTGDDLGHLYDPCAGLPDLEAGCSLAATITFFIPRLSSRNAIRERFAELARMGGFSPADIEFVQVAPGVYEEELGEIPPGETRRDSIDLELDKGTTELNGSLLIGP